MNPKFAIALEWPDSSTLHLVHLTKPYFVAAICRQEDFHCLVANLSASQWKDAGGSLSPIFLDAVEFYGAFCGTLVTEARLVAGRHGYEFPRFLMARASGGQTFIVEPEHSSPLVEVREPTADSNSAEKLNRRFDVVTAWRLAQMRKYYQRYLERQQGDAMLSNQGSSKLPLVQ